MPFTPSTESKWVLKKKGVFGMFSNSKYEWVWTGAKGMNDAGKWVKISDSTYEQGQMYYNSLNYIFYGPNHTNVPINAESDEKDSNYDRAGFKIYDLKTGELVDAVLSPSQQAEADAINTRLSNIKQTANRNKTVRHNENMERYRQATDRKKREAENLREEKDACDRAIADVRRLRAVAQAVAGGVGGAANDGAGGAAAAPSRTRRSRNARRKNAKSRKQRK